VIPRLFAVVARYFAAKFKHLFHFFPPRSRISLVHCRNGAIKYAQALVWDNAIIYYDCILQLKKTFLLISACTNLRTILSPPFQVDSNVMRLLRFNFPHRHFCCCSSRREMARASFFKWRRCEGK
jgi:hypothetical protein